MTCFRKSYFFSLRDKAASSVDNDALHLTVAVAVNFIGDWCAPFSWRNLRKFLSVCSILYNVNVWSINDEHSSHNTELFWNGIFPLVSTSINTNFSEALRSPHFRSFSRIISGKSYYQVENFRQKNLLQHRRQLCLIRSHKVFFSLFHFRYYYHSLFFFFDHLLFRYFVSLSFPFLFSSTLYSFSFLNIAIK